MSEARDSFFASFIRPVILHGVTWVTSAHIVEPEYARHAVLLSAMFPNITAEQLPLDTDGQREAAALACGITAGVVSRDGGRGAGGIPLENVIALYMPRLTDGNHAVVSFKKPNIHESGLALSALHARVIQRLQSETGEQGRRFTV